MSSNSGGRGRDPRNGSSQPQPTTTSNCKEAALNSMMPVLDELMSTTPVNNPQGVIQQQRQLRRLLHCLEDWDQINDDTLLKLIKQVKDRDLDTLDEKLGPLIQQILSGNWPNRSAKVVKAMEEFLSEILVAKSSFGGIVIQTLILKFMPSLKTAFKQPDEAPLVEEKKFQVVHTNLRKVFQAFPMKKESGMKTMRGVYPYMAKGSQIHYCYVKNLLETLKYLPDCEIPILHLIIHKLTRIDVNIPREHLEAALDKYNDSNFDVKNERGGRNTYNKMDIELDGMDPTPLENPLIETVDICLNLVFEHLTSNTFLAKPTSDDEEGAKDAELLPTFHAFLNIFEAEILPTFGVCNVQFLYFYMINLRPKFATTMLDFLWKKATSVNTSSIIRIQGMAYISGILARSTVISIKTLKRWLTRMADWANEYAENKVMDSHWSIVNVQAHGVFYAVCQALFYVFAFRNKELIGSRKCVAFTRTLNLGRLVTSQLNPLKVCSDEVAECFVNAAHQHQISYCHTVLERNRAATIPLISRESMRNLTSETASLITKLESFFPFDPFCLRRSKAWVDSIYRIYEPYLEELKIEKEEQSITSQDNEDSIEMELGSFNEKHSFRNRSFYCNGTIPFKFKAESGVKDELIDEFDV